MVFHLAVIGLCLASPALPGDSLSCSWIGGDGLWMSESNWSPTGIPGHTCCYLEHHATIDVPGVTVVLDESTSIDTLAVGSGATLTIADGTYLGFGAAFVNDGLIVVDGTINPTDLILGDIDGDIVIEGAGEIRFTSFPDSRLWGVGGPTITNSPGHALTGAGDVLRNGMGLLNLGLVEADVPGDTFQLNPAASLTVDNPGILRSGNGATLSLKSGVFDNTGGTIEALAGSIVDLGAGADLEGGTLRTEGDGVILITADVILRNHVIEGTLVIVNPNDPIFVGTFINNGEIIQDGFTSTTSARLGSGGMILGGTGTWTMGDAIPNQITATSSAGALLVHEESHTIEGGGNLGKGLVQIDNRGTIVANGVTPLTVQPKTDFGLLNSGSLVAEGEGGMVLLRGTHDNQPDGVIRVASTLVISPDTTVVNQGQLVLETPDAWIDQDETLTQTARGSTSLVLGDAATFGSITGAGVVALDGGLIVTLADGFMPGPDDTFTIIDVNAVTGTFATVTGPAGLNVTYLADRVVLDFACSGDADGDGQVNVADLLAVLAAWGTPAGDLNGDGTTNVADLLLVMSNWGSCA